MQTTFRLEKDLMHNFMQRLDILEGILLIEEQSNNFYLILCEMGSKWYTFSENLSANCTLNIDNEKFLSGASQTCLS